MDKFLKKPEMNKIKVSFDFDDTLTNLEVQKYVKNLLINNEVEVWVVTSRNQNDSKEVFEICNILGIQESNVIFTNKKHKKQALNKINPIWHLEYDKFQDSDIRDLNSTILVDVKLKDGFYSWKLKCESILQVLKENVIESYESI
jgi:hypothetical protein